MNVCMCVVCVGVGRRKKKRERSFREREYVCLLYMRAYNLREFAVAIMYYSFSLRDQWF